MLVLHLAELTKVLVGGRSDGVIMKSGDSCLFLLFNFAICV